MEYIIQEFGSEIGGGRYSGLSGSLERLQDFHKNTKQTIFHYSELLNREQQVLAMLFLEVEFSHTKNYRKLHHKTTRHKPLQALG